MRQQNLERLVQVREPRRAAAGVFSFGAEDVDAVLGGGLARGAVHELYAASHADGLCASGVALTLAMRAAGQRSILLARQDFWNSETGWVYGPGLSEVGADLSRLIFVRAKDAEAGLRVAEQGLSCRALGAVVAAFWGRSPLLTLTASRRLSLAAAQSGVPIFGVRSGTAPGPSAAETRWLVQSQPSFHTVDHAPGRPAFALSLLRHRGGVGECSWRLEWDRDKQCFDVRRSWPGAALPRRVVSVPNDGAFAQEPSRIEWLRAG